MFPDWKVDQLFQTHEAGIDFVPEPSKQNKATTTTQTRPVDQSATTLSNMLESIEQGLEAPAANGQVGWQSDRLGKPRTVSSPSVAFPLAVGAPESQEESPAHRIARSLVALSKRLRLSDAEIARLAQLAGHIVELDLTCSIDIDDAGWSTVTYSHQLLNLTNRPIKRLMTELWFENTDGLW